MPRAGIHYAGKRFGGNREKEWHIQRVIDTKVPIDIVTAAAAAAVS